MLILTCVLCAIGGAVFFRRPAKVAVHIVKSIVAIQPASQPTNRHTRKPTYLSYLELVRAENPAVATTQPLDFPLELADSAHLILRDPVCLDPGGGLWITCANGAPAATALRNPYETEDHVIQERPVFVHEFPDDAGNWAADLVVHDPASGYDLISKAGVAHLSAERGFQWSTAYSFQTKIVVCTDVGVSVFETQPKVQEHYYVLPGCDARTNPPATLLDTSGVLAWSPWEKGRPGSYGISRYVDGRWRDLAAGLPRGAAVVQWPAKPIQLSMLLDGSVLCIAGGTPASTAAAEGVVETDLPDQFPDQVHLSINQLEAPMLDEKHIGDLIVQLSDSDIDQRQSAYNELSRYGPTIAPLLEKVSDDQLPETRVRIRQLLRNTLTPALGGMMPVDNRLDVVRRCPDGTVLFFAPSGVQIPTDREEPDLVNPAWFALRADGRMERPLPAALVRDQQPDTCTLMSLRDEWVINDDAGPRRLVGTTWRPLLAPAEKRFSEIVGVASHCRWVFRDAAGQTLIIDPLLADPTPKLPAWTITANNGAAGWDTDGYPAVTRSDGTGTWELGNDGWKPLPQGQKLITKLLPASQPSTAETAGKLLLTAADGTKYFDGQTSIQSVGKTGTAISWPLPASAIGSVDPTLMETSDGLLFLYNQPGRLLRIRPTPSGPEPFKLEAVFTKDIPNDDRPLRIWLDPAGRIDFITGDNLLTLMFPAGNIPREISRMMLDDQP